MRDVTLLMVWLIGLFVLIGGVMAAVARFVRKDSVEYDKHINDKHINDKHINDKERGSSKSSET
jgi:hypothetical protein